MRSNRKLCLAPEEVHQYIQAGVNACLTFGGKFNPRAIAQAILLLPVPLGPMIMFKYGPGLNSTKSYVTKFLSCMRTIEPGMKLKGQEVQSMCDYMRQKKTDPSTSRGCVLTLWAGAARSSSSSSSASSLGARLERESPLSLTRCRLLP